MEVRTWWYLVLDQELLELSSAFPVNFAFAKHVPCNVTHKYARKMWRWGAEKIHI